MMMIDRFVCRILDLECTGEAQEWEIVLSLFPRHRRGIERFFQKIEIRVSGFRSLVDNQQWVLTNAETWAMESLIGHTQRVAV